MRSRSDTIAGVNRAILALLADGASAVTPNRRLARALLNAFDTEQRAAGRSAWPTPSILPYQTWLAVLWDECVARGVADEEPLLLTPAQSAVLWERIVDEFGGPLLNPRGAAALAAEAWVLMHAWGAGGESWRAWRRDDQEPNDASMFAEWAERYAQELHRIGAQDAARLPDTLAPLASRFAAWRPATILAGFIDLTPQQERLFAALRTAGATLHRVDTLPPTEARVQRVSAGSLRAEIAAALAWARSKVADERCDRVGVVIEDLAERRDEVVGLAQDILSPSSLLPGTASPPRVFEVSLGAPLASIPLVTAALGLIGLAGARLDAGDAAALLRSPYLPGGDEALAPRAAIERDWLEDGRREISLADAIVALDRRSPVVAARWREASRALARDRDALPREWSDRWRAWLTAAGWPGPRALDSSEYQARQAWERLLLQFSSLGAVAPPMKGAAALDKLRAMAREAVFQPEGAAAPIQILGVLEASGMAFDALWVAGLSADRWPPAPAPNPMLPIAWQRERRVPRSHSAGELAFARALTAGFAAAAPDVVFSFASIIDDRPSSPSALIEPYPEGAEATPPQLWSRSLALRTSLESIIDDHAPRIAPGSTAPGGSHIIASQSDCPFQAAARYRLGARPWPAPLEGLSPQERGELVHLAMAGFWRVVGDHETLISLDRDGLERVVRAAVEGTPAQFSAVRWRGLPALVRAAEAARLERLLLAWLEIEIARPPFAIEAIEAEGSVELATLKFRVRFDRIDVLDDGGVAIIDFKTGIAEKPPRWFDERPRATQLGTYVLAQRDARPERVVRAAAYAELRPEGVAAVGLASDEAAWPALTPVAKSIVGDWRSLEVWWRTRLGKLAQDIASGEALVSPRDKPLACRTCCLHPLCRIQSVRNLAEQSLDDE